MCTSFVMSGEEIMHWYIMHVTDMHAHHWSLWLQCVKCQHQLCSHASRDPGWSRCLMSINYMKQKEVSLEVFKSLWSRLNYSRGSLSEWWMFLFRKFISQRIIFQHTYENANLKIIVYKGLLSPTRSI